MSLFQTYLPVNGIINVYPLKSLTIRSKSSKQSMKQFVSGNKYFGRTSMYNLVSTNFKIS